MKLLNNLKTLAFSVVFLMGISAMCHAQNSYEKIRTIYEQEKIRYLDLTLNNISNIDNLDPDVVRKSFEYLLSNPDKKCIPYMMTILRREKRIELYTGVYSGLAMIKMYAIRVLSKVDNGAGLDSLKIAVDIIRKSNDLDKAGKRAEIKDIEEVLKTTTAKKTLAKKATTIVENLKLGYKSKNTKAIDNLRNTWPDYMTQWKIFMPILCKYSEKGMPIEIRGKAIFIMCGLGGSHAVEYLLKLLDDDDMKEYVLVSFAMIDDPTINVIFKYVSENDPNGGTRNGALSFYKDRTKSKSY